MRLRGLDNPSEGRSDTRDQGQTHTGVKRKEQLLGLRGKQADMACFFTTKGTDLAQRIQPVGNDGYTRSHMG